MFITVIVNVYICVYVYVACSGYTLGMVMRVLYAERPRDAINDDCELRKREQRAPWA